MLARAFEAAGGCARGGNRLLVVVPGAGGDRLLVSGAGAGGIACIYVAIFFA